MEDAKEKGHEGAAAASSAAGLDPSAAGISRLAAAEEPIATGDAGSGRAGRTGFSAPCGCRCSVRSRADVDRVRRRHSRRRHPERGAVRSLQPVSKHSPNQPQVRWPASQQRRCVEPAGAVSPTLPPSILFPSFFASDSSLLFPACVLSSSHRFICFVQVTVQVWIRLCIARPRSVIFSIQSHLAVRLPPPTIVINKG